MAENNKKLENKDEKDLLKTLKEKDKQIVEQTINVVQKKTKDVHKPRKLRKETARIKTHLNKIELERSLTGKPDQS